MKGVGTSQIRACFVSVAYSFHSCMRASLSAGGMDGGSGLTPLHQQQMLGGAAGGQSPANLMANFNYVQAMNALSQANLQVG